MAAPKGIVVGPGPGVLYHCDKAFTTGDGTAGQMCGVHGLADLCTGVSGSSNKGDGVDGSSLSGNGVWGHSQSNAGVQGESVQDWGVFGHTESSSNKVGGVIGDGFFLGVKGESSHGNGVYGTSGMQKIAASGERTRAPAMVFPGQPRATFRQVRT